MTSNTKASCKVAQKINVTHKPGHGIIRDLYGHITEINEYLYTDIPFVSGEWP